MQTGDKPSTVDEYLAVLPEDQRIALKHLRAVIKQWAPKAEEYISYGMPAYKFHGPLVYFAAFKNHCSFFPAGSRVLDLFAEELKPFRTSKDTLQFTPDQPIPDELVRQIVEKRIEENQERAALKKGKQ
jgi:uncharacterized protein YdhG (YjbR/CyaY superfamily)